MGQLWSRRLGRKWWQLRRWRKDDAPAEGKGRWSTLLVVHATIVAPFRLLLPPPLFSFAREVFLTILQQYYFYTTQQLRHLYYHTHNKLIIRTKFCIFLFFFFIVTSGVNA